MTKVTNISVLPDATQNFLEVYRKRQQRKPGSLEKKLMGAIFVFAILFIIFLILFLMAEYYYDQLRKEKVCTSKECIESAMTLLQTVDFSQDPCEDFYQFACGKFNVDHPIPENFLHNSWFVEKESRLSRMVLDILKNPVTPENIRPIKYMKEFYQSCVNKSELNSLGLQPLYDVLELLELPKFVPNNKTVENFSLGKTLALAQRYLSQDILVAVSLYKGVFNASDINKNSTVIKISPSINDMDIFDIWKPDLDIYGQKRFFKFRRKTEYFPSTDKQASRQVILATIKFIAAILEEINNDLQVDQEFFMVNTSNRFVTTAYKIVAFTSELVQDMDNAANETQNNTTTTEQMTFSSLQFVLDAENRSTLSSNRIDWKEYITLLFDKVNNTYDVETEPIIVENLEYFKYLTKVLGDAKPETIQRHIWWKIIEQYAKYTTSDIRAIYYRFYQTIYGESGSATRSYVCGNLLKDKMNVALSHEMSKMNNFSTTSQKVYEMLKDIEKSFEEIVKSMPWMDSESKSITLDKAYSVKNEIGYANWIMEPEKIDKHYKGLDLKKSEFLKNIVRISEWEVQKILEIIGPEKENATDFWYINPLQVNAYYSRDENAIIIPAGILQTPFYFRGLQSLNYGAIGTILGHELTHGFDVEGKNYNKFGHRQDNWWPNNITVQYESKAECFIRQYENYTLYENKKLNGTLTLAENIADNGGIRESFKAYQLYVKRYGSEEKLPGFENFTHEQLLFLSYANIWCEASVPKYYKLSQDSHSPQKVRVLASLQNMKEFSEVYNCSKNSFMNPNNKCVLW